MPTRWLPIPINVQAQSDSHAPQDELPVIAIQQRFGGPRMQQRWRQGLWFLPLAIIILVQVGVQQALLIIAGVAGFALVAFGGTAWLLGQSGLAVFGDAIVRTNGLGSGASCDRACVARVIEAPMVLTRLSPTTETFLIFLGQDDGALMHAYADYYTPDQLARFRSALGVPWERMPPRTFSALRGTSPGSFAWAWAHPWLTLLAVVAGPVLAWSVLAELLS